MGAPHDAGAEEEPDPGKGWYEIRLDRSGVRGRLEGSESRADGLGFAQYALTSAPSGSSEWRQNWSSPSKRR
jgi:hypothetical protein